MPKLSPAQSHQWLVEHYKEPDCWVDNFDNGIRSTSGTLSPDGKVLTEIWNHPVGLVIAKHEINGNTASTINVDGPIPWDFK